jgi:hypothetical protein
MLVLSMPGDMKWSSVKYDDEVIRLVKTDLDKLSATEDEPCHTDNGRDGDVGPCV